MLLRHVKIDDKNSSHCHLVLFWVISWIYCSRKECRPLEIPKNRLSYAVWCWYVEQARRQMEARSLRRRWQGSVACLGQNKGMIRIDDSIRLMRGGTYRQITNKYDKCHAFAWAYEWGAHEKAMCLLLLSDTFGHLAGLLLFSRNLMEYFSSKFVCVCFAFVRMRIKRNFTRKQWYSFHINRQIVCFLRKNEQRSG